MKLRIFSVASIKERTKRSLINLLKKRVISEYSEHLHAPASGRALLSYLVLPLLPPPALRDTTKFSNRGIAQEIPRVLNELGYIVDIVNYDNTSWLPKKHYDLFIGHAGINFKRLSNNLSPDAKRIYFSTGLYWKEGNLRQAQRLSDVASRRHCLFPPERFITFDEEDANESADLIICLGNQRVRDSYARFSRVININNAIFPIEFDRHETKDFDAGRKHFLYFSGRGNVHKGLDLLLESFVDTDLHLHICQHMQNEFIGLYKKELTEEPNIHVHGFVKMRSRQFEDLVLRCNWLVSATCAEGQPGAVLEGMAHGLIPMLTDAANIDVENLGIRMQSTKIEDIRSLIYHASQIDTESCRSMAKRCLKEARKTYSVENFRNSLRQAISQVSATNIVREDRREGRVEYD